MPSLRDLVFTSLLYPVMFILALGTGWYLEGMFAATAGSIAAGAIALYLLRIAEWHSIVGVSLVAYSLGAAVAIGVRFLLGRIGA